MKKSILKTFLLLILVTLSANIQAQETNIYITNNNPNTTPYCGNTIRFYNSANVLLGTSSCIYNSNVSNIFCLSGRIDYITVDDCSGCTPFRVNMGATSLPCGLGCGACYCVSVTTVQTLGTPPYCLSSTTDIVTITLN